MTRNDLVNAILNGKVIYLDGNKDDDYKYEVLELNEKNFKLNDLFKNQASHLINNSYIGICTPRKLEKPYDMCYLPIYGSSNGYVLKWFTNCKLAAVEADLKQRGFGLLKRAI